MRYSILIIVFGIVLFSCRKEFNHTVTAPDSCEDCAAADALEGKYRGLATGVAILQGSGGTLLSDSMTVEIEHVFRNLGPFIDSTDMFFRFTYIYDFGATETQIHKVDVKTGVFDYVVSDDWRHQDVASITEDELKVYYRINPEMGSEFLWLDYTGYRVP